MQRKLELPLYHSLLSGPAARACLADYTGPGGERKVTQLKFYPAADIGSNIFLFIQIPTPYTMKMKWRHEGMNSD